MDVQAHGRKKSSVKQPHHPRFAADHHLPVITALSPSPRAAHPGCLRLDLAHQLTQWQHAHRNLFTGRAWLYC